MEKVLVGAIHVNSRKAFRFLTKNYELLSIWKKWFRINGL